MVKRRYKSLFDEIIKEIKLAGSQFGLNNVFSGYLEYHALKISVSNDMKNMRERQDRLTEFKNRIQPNLLSVFELLIKLVEQAIADLKDDPKDVLGEVYHNLNLNNEWAGQYFTPDNVARLMATLVNSSGTDYIRTLSEPACGSGVMIIASACSLLSQGINPTERLLVQAQDLDIRCVWMAYIQLSLYEIPAVINHGNTLTCEIMSSWYTKNYWEVMCKLCVSRINN